MLPLCQHVLDTFRNAVNDQDDNAIIPMIDALAECGDTSAEELADLFHNWLKTQTYVRMTEQRDEWFEKLCDWNTRYTEGKTVLREDTGIRDCLAIFTRPIGDMYTRLQVPVQALDHNPRYLSKYPIRELHLTRTYGKEKALINLLGNYRLKKLWRLVIDMDRAGQRAFTQEMILNFSKCVPMKALKELEILGVNDRDYRLSSLILGSKKLNKGCVVWVNSEKHTVK